MLYYNIFLNNIVEKYNLNVRSSKTSNNGYIVRPTSGTKKDYYIYGGDGIAAIYRIKDVNLPGSMYYIHKDNLGSFDIVTDESGDIADYYSFDAWGNRRDPNNWTNTDWTNHLFNRGFTGHEHLDKFGLINMNGRCYDPLLGRFLSPDPFIQAPDNTQNYNRYSYCLNNPFAFTDPSGYYNSGISSYNNSDYTNYITNVNNSLQWDTYNYFCGNKNQNSYYIDGISVKSTLGYGGSINTKDIDHIELRGENINVSSWARFRYNGGTHRFTYYNNDCIEVISTRVNDQISVECIFDKAPHYIYINTVDRLTHKGAKEHFQDHTGTPVAINSNTIDFSKVKRKDFKNRIAHINLAPLMGNQYSNASDGLVHGSMTLILTPDGEGFDVANNNGKDDPSLAGLPAGMYDFDMKPWLGNTFRNLATIALWRAVSYKNGDYVGGTPFAIYYYGTVKLND